VNPPQPSPIAEEVPSAPTYEGTGPWTSPVPATDHEALLRFIREAAAREAWIEAGHFIEHLMSGSPPGWVLETLLAIPPERITAHVLDAVRRHGRRDMAELLVDLAGGGSIVVRQAAIRTLGSFRGDVAREALLSLLAGDPRTEIRATVAQALEGDLAPGVTAALLEAFLGDPIRSVAQHAASSLRRRDTREVAHALLARIGRGEMPDDRALVAWTIVCESPLEIEEYLPVLADSARRAGDIGERRLLVRLIASTGEPAAAPVLISLYRESDDPLIQTHVLGGLENNPAPEVDPFLRAELVSHPSKLFQERARQILERREKGSR
jgi:hypothetical protein